MHRVQFKSEKAEPTRHVTDRACLAKQGTRIDEGIGPYPKPPEFTLHPHSLFRKTTFDDSLSCNLKKI